MSAGERDDFLKGQARTATLATVRPDGRPHAAPIWFDLQDGTIFFTTWHESVKAKNLQSNPLVSLCVDDGEPPFAFITVEGEASVTSGDPELRYWATRIAGRYMGEELAESYGERNSVEGELLVRVSPHKIVARKNVAG